MGKLRNQFLNFVFAIAGYGYADYSLNGYRDPLCLENLFKNIIKAPV